MPSEKRKALFICNEKFLRAGEQEGGVKFCTDEFRHLLQHGFDVKDFPVSYSITLTYRLRKKFGLNVYNDYNPEQYKASLRSAIENDGVRFIFLNLTNTAPFAKLIKEISPETKVILCSHGNESGDFLHDIVMHKKFKGVAASTSLLSLGKMLTEEARQRAYIDLVLTVSEIEEGVEKWIGAGSVYMVPRFIEKRQSPYHPQPGLTGFLSDLSHEPNFFGISAVCEEIEKIPSENIMIHLAGGGRERGEFLQKKYPFVKYLGYLPDKELEEESASWTFALNPVMYYSRGVSTKLGKSLGMGQPVITTKKGLRGYIWKEGELPVCENASQMAALIVQLSSDKNQYSKYHEEVLKIQQSSPSYEMMMNDILKLL